LAYILKLMSQFSVMPSDFDVGAHDDIFDLLDSPVKKMRKNKPPMEKFVVPRLNKVLQEHLMLIRKQVEISRRKKSYL